MGFVIFKKILEEEKTKQSFWAMHISCCHIESTPGALIWKLNTGCSPGLQKYNRSNYLAQSMSKENALCHGWARNCLWITDNLEKYRGWAETYFPFREDLFLSFPQVHLWFLARALLLNQADLIPLSPSRKCIPFLVLLFGFVYSLSTA